MRHQVKLAELVPGDYFAIDAIMPWTGIVVEQHKIRPLTYVKVITPAWMGGGSDSIHEIGSDQLVTVDWPDERIEKATPAPSIDGIFLGFTEGIA